MADWKRKIRFDNWRAEQKNWILLSALIFCSTVVIGQPAVKESTAQKMPLSLHYEGKPVRILEWMEGSERHLFIASEKGETGPGEDEKSAFLYAYHYIIKADNGQLIWKLNDRVKYCPFDIEANFILSTLSITDLDKNGVSEIWMMYRLGCRSDVSPLELKLIVYNGKTKMAMRGNTKVPARENEYSGGDYTFDSNFRNAASSFRARAEKIWKEHVTEKYD